MGNRTHTAAVTSAHSSRSSRKPAGLQCETLSEESYMWGRSKFCSRNSVQKWACKAGDNTTLLCSPIFYLPLRFNRSGTGQPHCAGVQLAILHLLRGCKKSLDSVPCRVRFTSGKTLHLFIWFYIYRGNSSTVLKHCRGGHNHLPPQCKASSFGAFSLHPAAELPLFSTGLWHQAQDTKTEAQGIPLQCNSILLSLCFSLQPAAQELGFYKQLTAVEGDNREGSPLAPQPLALTPTSMVSTSACKPSSQHCN